MYDFIRHGCCFWGTSCAGAILKEVPHLCGYRRDVLQGLVHLVLMLVRVFDVALNMSLRATPSKVTGMLTQPKMLYKSQCMVSK